MIRVNLLPVRTSRRLEAVHREVRLALVGAAILVLACVAVFIWQTATANDLHAENARLQKDLETLKIAVARVDEVEKMNAELRRKLDVIAELQANKVGPVHLLDELVSATPEKLSITSLKQDAVRVALLGDAASNEVISQFLVNLEKSAWLDEVYLVSIDQDRQGAYTHKTFQISARLVIPEEEQERQKLAARAALEELDATRPASVGMGPPPTGNP
ncbi:MAG: PilN domain-containing protein [Deltaproteobacteria bacterium]|nr:PilN domain-containing protein [Deltaproteobacteria bacterium]